MWQWSGSSPIHYGAKSTKGEKLGDYIRIRQDTEKYGFIFNLKTGVVFYADTEGIECATKNLQSPLEILQQQEPQLLKDLKLIT